MDKNKGAELFRKLIARQLACPSGLIGRWVTAGWLDRVNAGMNQLTLEQLSLETEDSVIEIGFGGGGLLEQIVLTGKYQYVAGIDRSVDMVRQVDRRLNRMPGSKVDLRQGEIEKIPFGVDSFTKLCSVNTLYFWEHPEVAMAECQRVLRPGGRMTLCFNSKQNLIDWPVHRHGFKLYEIEEVEDLFSSAGFESLEVASDEADGRVQYYCVSGIATGGGTG